MNIHHSNIQFIMLSQLLISPGSGLATGGSHMDDKETPTLRSFTEMSYQKSMQKVMLKGRKICRSIRQKLKATCNTRR